MSVLRGIVASERLAHYSSKFSWSGIQVVGSWQIDTRQRTGTRDVPSAGFSPRASSRDMSIF